MQMVFAFLPDMVKVITQYMLLGWFLLFSCFLYGLVSPKMLKRFRVLGLLMKMQVSILAVLM